MMLVKFFEANQAAWSWFQRLGRMVSHTWTKLLKLQLVIRSAQKQCRDHT